MRAFCIYLVGNDVAERGLKNLRQSSLQFENDFDIEGFPATTPEQVDHLMEDFGLEWTWPWKGRKKCEKTGITMVPYATRVPARRIACALSHFRLWQFCVGINEPILILEQDAIFLTKLPYQDLIDSKYGVIGINNPHGATRLPSKYDSVTQSSEGDIVPCPKIDRDEIAQGTAGASAYMIKPQAAADIICEAYAVGLWPNDALICQQLFDFIGQTKVYYTKVQGLGSTTSG